MSLILASGSEIRATLFRNANVPFEVAKPRVDEDAIKAALLAEDTSPRDIADALAEAKARKVSGSHPGALVLGCDQVLNLDGALISKPATREEALADLTKLRGKTHKLHSAAVIYLDGQPQWRQITTAKLTMRDFSDTFLAGYLDRTFESIRHSVGGYKLEEEGVRLFSRIEGDYFTILGLPFLEILSYLTLQGRLQK